MQSTSITGDGVQDVVLSTAAAPSGPSQSLARGLWVLQRIAESRQRLTAAQLAEELGTHQSSVSRMLSTLMAAGLVRREESGHFGPDYGIIGLVSHAAKLPLIQRPWQVFREFSTSHPDLSATLAMLWRGQLVYGQKQRGRTTDHARRHVTFPLHRSSPGLRMLLDLPEAHALALLKASRSRHGWSGDPEVVPQEPADLLERARTLCEHETLILGPQWALDVQQSGAIPVHTTEPHPVALAVLDHDGTHSPDELRLILHTLRRDLELAFRQSEA